MAVRRNKNVGETEDKKTAADIIIENFLRDVDEKEAMPWQMPYERYDSFNWVSKNPYRGINRLMLPSGEYLTKNQIYTINQDKGYLVKGEDGKMHFTEDAYRFVKGIRWYPVVFFKKNQKEVSESEILEKFPDWNKNAATAKKVFVGYDGKYAYYYNAYTNTYTRSSSILRYYLVAERKYFQNSKGECLPSRIETGEVTIEKQKPQEVFNRYIERSGVRVGETADVPCYIPALDTVMLNKHIKSEDSWFATAFHELSHSTGAVNRLNRPGVAKISREDVNQYAVEECIAEISSCLCCAETGIYDFKTSGTEEYDNNVAYVQAWKKRVKDWGKDFIYIVAQADKAFNYICNNIDETNDEEGDDDKED